MTTREGRASGGEEEGGVGVAMLVGNERTM